MSAAPYREQILLEEKINTPLTERDVPEIMKHFRIDAIDDNLYTILNSLKYNKIGKADGEGDIYFKQKQLIWINGNCLAFDDRFVFIGDNYANPRLLITGEYDSDYSKLEKNLRSLKIIHSSVLNGPGRVKIKKELVRSSLRSSLFGLGSGAYYGLVPGLAVGLGMFLSDLGINYITEYRSSHHIKKSINQELEDLSSDVKNYVFGNDAYNLLLSQYNQYINYLNEALISKEKGIILDDETSSALMRFTPRFIKGEAQKIYLSKYSEDDLKELRKLGVKIRK